MPATEQRELLLPGPWNHRDVTAGGVRLHVAEAGDGPLVVLLHGFPEIWWAWRAQIPALAEAGYRVIAPDLRGFGASDKPPRPYDLVTIAGDIAGLVRALGESRAHVIGHDLGGLVAWTMGALHPELVAGVGVLGSAHPRRWRREMVFTGAQRRASGYVFGFQPPRLPEARLTRRGGALVERLMRSWSGPWRETADFADAVRIYRAAAGVPQASYGAAEHFRWMVRSLIRPDGFAFVRSLRRRIEAPVLQLHGADDGCVLPATASGSGAYVLGDYRWRLLDGCGHFPAEEQPELVTGELVRWLEETAHG